MSDLNAAMQAAVESVDEQQRSRHRSSGDARVAVRQESTLPPLAGRPSPTTFRGVVHATLGPVAATVWLLVRELFALAVTFWVAAIVVTFAAPGQATLAVVVTATGALRVLFLAATWTRQVAFDTDGR